MIHRAKWVGNIGFNDSCLAEDVRPTWVFNLEERVKVFVHFCLRRAHKLEGIPEAVVLGKLFDVDGLNAITTIFAICINGVRGRGFRLA